MDSTVGQVVQSLVKREECGENEYNGMLGARISSVFVVLVASSFGAVFPILSSRYSFIRLPGWCFFIAKFFGSGVIIATAFIHLLEPAADALGNECLGDAWGVYPYAYAICLVTLFIIFFCELLAFRYVDKKIDGNKGGHSHSHFGDTSNYVKNTTESDEEAKLSANEVGENPYPKHFSHAYEHKDDDTTAPESDQEDIEGFYGKLLAIFVLEFGIIFHSVFVGLSLATAGDEFKTLYPVIVFHQLFEGLGLGTRIAATPWPKTKRWTPWLLAIAYGLCTPIAIAIGLGVRKSYSEDSHTALIVNGVFDSVSAGILLYTGLVELMAHEFLFTDDFKGDAGFKRMVVAYVIMCVGAGLMALLGRWA
ncbi:low-affinity Zn(2+) transporter zrt2 [Candidozyma auris]|uniref:Uncharacterized protein n=2 Tax=Candidozyma auris TaxID=498019 RepID=A0AB36W7N3_CANAR|nr:low-affinity Zn(2+) transporter ZRT2 [[Candida] auris]KND98349.1 hypothetical protein QG37_04880 [[Candida] auris]PIS52046.1 hypothetical protein B9J08_003657 [[Candida] auris]PIS54034.1 hypothetical protein CJI97_003732 [[Candida] auris]QEO21347.1 hypothetical_protein [[Candida] auris]QWW21642.1 hypothetical protein CA7LBN_000388 [[Candida] auris]